MELSPEDEARLNAQLATLRERQAAQADAVKALKTKKASKDEIKAAVADLNAVKAEVAAVLLQLFPPEKYDVNRTALDELLRRRLFVLPAFSIYGGSSGLYDYGPQGCAVKANFLDFWRQFFVLEDNMLQVDTSVLTPSRVLEVSGHVEKFKDWMVQDKIADKCIRADHLVEDWLEEQIAKDSTPDDKREEMRKTRLAAGNYDDVELDAVIKKYDIKSPDGNPVSDTYAFNLMFETQLGPHSQAKAYLRPETAQGMFVNFRSLLDGNYGKLPFAAACIGQAFRNEIAPRNGLIRVREFTLAEIEHFLYPDEKSHPKFANVAQEKLTLLRAVAQEEGGDGRAVTCTLQQALDDGIIGNTTMGYYIGRTHQFLIAVGIKKFRFRQHKQKEMAHYAKDCWDAEILSSHGWVECVGIADRACFDLERHATATNQKFGVFREYPDGPRTVSKLEAKLDKGKLGKALKKDAKHVFQHFAIATEEDRAALAEELLANGKIELRTCGGVFTLTPDMVSFKTVEKREAGEAIIPGVIEPAFGVGRIIHCIFEHCYNVRPDDEQRGYLSFSPVIAPVKCSVLPLVSTPELQPFVDEISRLLTDANITSKVDDVSHTIGRRYARTDEIGIPFGITVDFDTPKDRTVTLRDRDSTRQVRLPIDELTRVVDSLVRRVKVWSDVEGEFPVFSAAADAE